LLVQYFRRASGVTVIREIRVSGTGSLVSSSIHSLEVETGSELREIHSRAFFRSNLRALFFVRLRSLRTIVISEFVANSC
jgi:hypothetical protein